MKLSNRYRKILIRFGKIAAFCAAVLVTTKLTLIFSGLANTATAAFTFLIVVLLSAYFGDLLVAIVTSLAATLCFNYFYLPPVGTFNIAAFSDWISLAAFLLASVIISRLAASAAENKGKAAVLNKSLAKLKEFGEWLLTIPPDKLTLSGIAQKTLSVFSLEYCSIHVYGEGKWQHFTGTAVPSISKEIESRLKAIQDHSTDLMELAEESEMGVHYAQIRKGTSTLAVLAVKGGTLPFEAVGTIASLIGVQLNLIMKD
jgi:two-component system, OmpR family, sensor histidine kinase KdpD